MIKNVYRKEGTNEFFVRDAGENEYNKEDVYICNASQYAIVSREGIGYTILGDVPLEIAKFSIKLNDRLVRLYSDNGNRIAEIRGDILMLEPGRVIRIVTGNFINNYKMIENFIIAI